jgi:hypothetical protein
MSFPVVLYTENCAVWTGKSAGLRNVLSSRPSYRELRSLDRQKRGPQECPFQSSFIQRTAQFGQAKAQASGMSFPGVLHTENCAVWTGKSAGLRNVLSSRPSNRELRSSLRESHTYSVQFFLHFFNTVKMHSSTLCVWGPFRQRGHWDRPVVLYFVKNWGCV